MMSKKWMAALLALAMTLMMSSTAFAGWEQYQSGEWAYRYLDWELLCRAGRLHGGK